MAGTLTISTLSDGTYSTSASNLTRGACQAWANWDGANSPYSIRASYNVSSVTRNASGDYTVNYTNAITDANYSALATCLMPDDGVANTAIGYYTGGGATSGATYTTTQCRLLVQKSGGSNFDVYIISFAVFR